MAPVRLKRVWRTMITTMRRRALNLNHHQLVSAVQQIYVRIGDYLSGSFSVYEHWHNYVSTARGLRHKADCVRVCVFQLCNCSTQKQKLGVLQTNCISFQQQPFQFAAPPPPTVRPRPQPLRRLKYLLLRSGVNNLIPELPYCTLYICMYMYSHCCFLALCTGSLLSTQPHKVF